MLQRGVRAPDAREAIKMQAIHLKTVRMRSEQALERLKQALGQIAGVSRVAVVKSAGVVSVLFDETVASAEQIVNAVRSAGFDATLYSPAF